MNTSNRDIARVAGCTEGAVRASIKSGKLDAGDLSSVVDFVFRHRVKRDGIKILDGIVPPKIAERLPPADYDIDYEYAQV